MIMRKKDKILRLAKVSFVASAMTVSPVFKTYAQEMPTGGSVVSGNVSINSQNADHMIINQTSNKSIINWQGFSIHEKGRVDFNMPGSQSMSLNRVNGSTPSNIAGKLNSNGKVFLVNPNGVFITPTGTVKTSSFTASSLDINNQDFLNGNLTFKQNNKNKGVSNSGRITIGDDGQASLIGSNVRNSGVISARLGRINLGAGEKITLNLEGDGLMAIVLPVEKLDTIKDVNGNTIKSLITNNGKLLAEGGTIQLSAQTANSLSMGAINTGQSSEIIATSYKNQSGKVVIGGSSNNYVQLAGKIDVSGKKTTSPSGTVSVKAKNVYQGGNIHANGNDGGQINILSEDILVLDGKMEAIGKNGNGGSLIVMSENSLFSSPDNSLDVSGKTKGGVIKSTSKNFNFASGSYKANSSSGKGGHVDITSNYVGLAYADVSATGKTIGGKARIGGEYLGGKTLPTTTKKEYQGFIGRYENQPTIKNAKQTIVQSSAKIDVSSVEGKGGTAVVWSDEITDFSGEINANGGPNEAKSEWITQASLEKDYNEGGFVEISSSNLLRNLDLTNVSVKHGTLLLDPKNITVDSSSGAGSLSSGLRAQVYYGYFNDDLSWFSGRSQDSRSSVKNRFTSDFTRVNYSTPGRNFAERYSAEWRGFFKPPTTGSYRFQTSSDDASWMWLFNTSQVSSWSNFISYRSKSNEIVDNSRPHGIRTRYSSYMTLQEDTYYPILAYFGERTGGDAMKIRWTGPGQNWTDNGSNVYFHNDSEFSSGAFTGIDGGDITTVNAFATDSSSSNNIGSSTIADLLSAGTDVYLRANQDITISNAITATGSSGGDLSFLAGRDITINSNITTANGDFTMRANTSTSYGVVDGQRGSGTADIANNATINAGTGTVSAIIDGGAGLTNDQPGSIALGNITAGSIVATGDSATGTITGTSLTASGSGTAINISGYDVGAISSLSASSGNWRLSRLATNNSTMSNVPAASFIQYNYSSGDSALGSGNGIFHGYNPGAISKSYDYVRSGGSSLGYRAVKTYDGSTSTSGVTYGTATVVGANSLPSEVTVSLSSPTLTYDTKDFNNNSKTITAGSTYTISSATHGRHGTVHGLAASSSAQTISNARISKRTTIVSGSRLYDASTKASASDLSTISGTVGSETLTLTGLGSIASKNVGPNKSVTLGSLEIGNGQNGGLASNYSLSSGTVSVQKRPISLSGLRANKRGSTNVFKEELKIRNVTKGETLRLRGSGLIVNNNAKKHLLKTGTLELVDDTGSSSNYTLTGGEHSFEIKYAPKNIVRDKLVALKKRGKKLFVRAPVAPKAPAISVAAAPAPTSSPSPGGGGQSSGGGGGPAGGGGSESGDSGESGKEENE